MAYGNGGNLEIVSGDGSRYRLVGAGPAYGDSDLMRMMSTGADGDDSDAAATLIARARANNAVVVRENMPTKSRIYPLGFDSTVVVPPGVQATINSQPQVTFRVERLVVPSDFGGSFVLDDFIVGKNSQFANEVAVPARIFDERAEGVRLRGDTAQTSQNVVLKVTNVSGAGIRFRAAVIGTALDG